MKDTNNLMARLRRIVLYIFVLSLILFVIYVIFMLWAMGQTY